MSTTENTTHPESYPGQNPESLVDEDSHPTSRLGQTLIYGVGVLFFLIVSVVVWYIIDKIETQTREDISDSLKTVLRTTQAALYIWEFERKSDVASWSASKELQAVVKELLKVPHTSEELIKSPAQEKLRELLEPHVQGYGYLGYFIIDPDFINIGSTRRTNLGSTNLLFYHGEFLDEIFDGETMTSHPLVSDVPLYNQAGRLAEGEPTMFVVAPIFDDHHEVMAALAFRIDPAVDFTRILQLGRTGKTGETYAFNSSAKLLSESRFDLDLRRVGLIPPDKRGILSIDIRDPGGDLLAGYQPELPRHKQPYTFMANWAIARKRGVNMDGYRNYRGVRVVSAWTWDLGLDFGLVTEINEAEAYQSFIFTRGLILVAMGLTGFIALGFTVLVNIGRTRALSLVAAVDVGRTRALQFAKIAQEREARIRAVVDNVGDAIITMGETGIIESFSPAAEKIFGYFAPEVVGRKINMLMPEPDTSQHDDYLRSYLETGVAKIIGIGREVDGLKKDGTVFPLDIAVSEVRLEDRRLFIGTMRDITRRKEAEDELKQSHNELQEAHQDLQQSLAKVQEAHHSLVASEKLAGIGGLTSGVCREVINILGSVSNQAQKLAKEKSGSDVTESLDKMKREMGQIEKIIRSLLKFSSTEAPSFKMVRIHEELDSILTLVEHHMQLHDIEVIREFDPGLAELRVNPDEIGQTFLYIIDNARQAMPEGGTLTASTGPMKKNGSNYIRIKIADTGTGIKKDDLEKIFEAFFSSKPEGEGTGMGLAVCRTLIEKHGGSIGVESEWGEGTTFIIDLPV